MKTNDLYDAVQEGEIDINSPILVDIFDGPIGGYGFRSGQWPVKIGNIKFSMFGSISHRLDLAEQNRILTDNVRLKIEQAISGETYIDHAGNVALKYDPQMKRINEISSAAAALGSKGGSIKSDKKAASSRINGKLGGRPKKHFISPENEAMYRKLQSPGEKHDEFYLRADGVMIYLPSRGRGYIK